MAITPTIQAPQLQAMTGNQGNSDLNVSQFRGFVGYTIPTTSMQVAQFQALVSVTAANEVQSSQVAALVAYLGAPENRRARSWTFSLDGHDFYVLRLGEDQTLVYDLTTDSWMVWGNRELLTWRLHLGTNWISMARANYLGGAQTNVVGGDDVLGLLWTLDPATGLDDAAIEGDPPEAFTRVISGGLPARMRQSVRNSAVFVTINTGNPAFVPATIELRTSDDSGKSFQSQGTVDVPAGEYSYEVMWRSLGLIRAPGRIFEFVDSGATVRIDGVDVRVSGDTQDG